MNFKQLNSTRAARQLEIFGNYKNSTGFYDQNGDELLIGDKALHYNPWYDKKFEGEIKIDSKGRPMWKEKDSWHGIGLDRDFAGELEIKPTTNNN